MTTIYPQFILAIKLFYCDEVLTFQHCKVYYLNKLFPHGTIHTGRRQEISRVIALKAGRRHGTIVMHKLHFHSEGRLTQAWSDIHPQTQFGCRTLACNKPSESSGHQCRQVIIDNDIGLDGKHRGHSLTSSSAAVK